MNISKALKVKNRLIGEINQLKEIFRRENSRREDSVSKVNQEELFGKLSEAGQKLERLKGAIGQATAPISKLLSSLTEAKANIIFYNSLPCREGIEYLQMGAGNPPTEFKWNSYLNRQKIDEIVFNLQKAIDAMQDEIDNFNATTQIEFEE